MDYSIETPRLYIRPIGVKDAADIFEYCRNEQVGYNAGWKAHENVEETLRLMEVVFMREHVFGIELKETGKLIGSLGLVDDPKRANPNVKMLGYSLGEAYWGNGYMTEAARALLRYGFEVLELDLISAYCYPFNERSKKVLRKLGFVYEGRLALCEITYTGEVLDNECYALKRRESLPETVL